MQPGVRVGEFEILADERRLVRGSEEIELGARAFDLLCVLAERPGHLVTKATLLERVWPGLVVDENNLPAQVANLRRALGAGAIRTVPGFGYRLELRPAAPGAEAPIVEASHLAPLPPASPAASLIGREEELEELSAWVRQARVVSVVGGPGLGKTRLAQEVVARAAAPAAWVDLQPLADVAQCALAVAVALDIGRPDTQDTWAAIARAVGSDPAWLALDCAESLGAALRAPLSRMLRECPALRLLVTSQAPLDLPEERVFRLRALPVPGPGASAADLLACGAVRLFAARAAARDHRFDVTAANVAQVAEICRRLDGNPLALELAAARLPSLGLPHLLDRMDDRLRVLRRTGGGEDPRHDTLSAAFDWSHALLGPAEQRVFARLGVFQGSFDLHVAAHTVADGAIDAAEAVDWIGRLVERSLVVVVPGDPPRLRLAETAQLYARARLDAAGELATTQERMAVGLLERVDRAWQEYWSLDEALWLARYGPDLDSLRAACDLALRGDPEVCVGLYGSAWPLLVEAGLHEEWRARFDRVVPRVCEGVSPARVGRFWEAVASLDSGRRVDRARYAAELAADLHGRAGDVRGRYYALLVAVLNDHGDGARAALEAARTLEDPAWPPRLLALGDRAEAELALAEGDLSAARSACARSARHALATSERQALAASVLQVEIDWVGGDPVAALQLARPLAAGMRHAGRSDTRLELLAVALCALVEVGALGEARQLAAELRELGLRADRGRLFEALDAMACLACASGRAADAARIVTVADEGLTARGARDRRPAARRARARLEAALTAALGEGWSAEARAARPRLDEVRASALALGLD